VSLMGSVQKLQVRAAGSRRADHRLPVVATVEEASALARDIARQLTGLSEPERLLAMSNLDEVRRALDGRMDRLSEDLAASRAELQALNRGLAAAGGYAGPRKSGR
jgi:hypothetical protein